MLLNLNELITPLAEKVSAFCTLDCSIPEAFASEVKTINKDRVEYGKSTSCITNNKGQRIFMSNTWFYIAAILAPLYKPFNEYKTLAIDIIGKDILKDNGKDNYAERVQSAINASNLESQDKEYLLRFATDSLWWNGGNSNTGGKSLDRNDALVSAVLSIANLVNASQSYVATLWDFFGNNPKYIKLFENAADDIISSQNNFSKSSVDAIAQTIFYGCPGTGKSFRVKQITEGEEGEKAIYFGADDKRVDLPEKKERNNTPSNVFRTTFHPDYDYATFVGTYKPIMKTNKDENGNETESLSYDFVPQVFTNAYIRAYKSLADDDLKGSDKNVYLIIEEINRGNCAQIFGDLFQLLDRTDGWSDYSVTPDAELKDYLVKKGISHDKLRLPPNLYIYATMNTSDQSLFPMDSAFKRRWAMEYIPIRLKGNKAENYIIKIYGKEYKWTDFLRAVNQHIRKATDSEDKQMGEFFVKSEVITEDEFRNKIMFYIWNDVCKDLYSASHRSETYFMRDSEETAFTFAELFGDGRKEQKNMPDATPEELILGFMNFLKLTPANVNADGTGAEEPEDTLPESNE